MNRQIVRGQLPHLLWLLAHVSLAAVPAPDIERFLTESMKEARIPGAVFLLIEDGNVVLARGFGNADLTRNTAIDPDTTLFRVASVSKLITATAILQLHERGRVSIDDDVNRYLKGFRVDDRFPQPVTLANLLTHTAGFDERAIGVAATSPEQLAPLGEYLPCACRLACARRAMSSHTRTTVTACLAMSSSASRASASKAM